MHRCLLIPEIVSMICQQCDYPSRPTLAALARTCQLFSEPALQCLWEEVEGLAHLIRCMPADLWKFVDGTNPHQHLEAVHYVGVSNGVSLVSAALFRWPNLQNVRVSEMSAAAYKHLAGLPTLESLTIELSEESNIAAPFTLPLAWDTPPFPALQRLMLQYFDISFCAQMLENLSTTLSLSSMVLSFRRGTTPSRWKQITSVLKRRLEPTLLSYLVMHDNTHTPIEQDNLQFAVTESPIGFEHLEPLLSFCNMEVAQLSPFYGFSLDDHSIERIAKAWPRLCILGLSGHSERPHNTLHSLAHLAKYCRVLDLISISVDACVACSPSTPRVYSNAPLHLQVRNSPIDDVEMVTLYLYDVFPRFDTLYTDDAADQEPDQEAGYRAKWVGVAENMRFLRALGRIEP
ncbi:hypothetical protein H0H81_004334 [Sphagnurus paluster]|uniref:F-box domain-containing protein n=1 Tax=Sphagnurus paluster TaxID=117069 RepID=A0A9P7FSV5_9AGAR|nr:hypothetical protein H0H81_004334 [Sphagnurus paluster]